MRSILSIKTLFRSVVKTFFTFLLIAAVTFGLFSQVSEYVNTKQEFERNLDMYYGYGTVEVSPAQYKNIRWPYYIESDPRVDCFPLEKFNKIRYTPLSIEQIKEIEALPYVSSTYKRYMTGGICEDLYRDFDFSGTYDYAARLVVEATLKEVESNNEDVSFLDPLIHLEDFQILAGQAERENISLKDDNYNMSVSYRDRILSLDYLSMSPLEGFWDNGNLFGNEFGKTLVTHRVLGLVTQSYIYNEEYLKTFDLGKRYVFIIRFERNKFEKYTPQNKTLYLSDFLTEPWCKAIWDISDAPENYLELEEYAPLKECIEITNSDVHTLDVVYTDDMSVIRQIKNDSMRIKAGRWLTPEDTENNVPVCVINEEFADNNDLKIGDTISLKLGDELFEQFYTLGAVAVTPERYADNWTEETDFEIVGIYSDIIAFNRGREPNWTYSNNTVFVPLNFLPLSEDELEGHEFSPSEFNFRVDNAWDIEPFMEECIPQIEAMGLTVTFDDGGWSEVAQPYREAQHLAKIRIALLAGVTVIATGFVVYLFISRKRTDYAVMRALGTPKARSARSLLLPLMVLSAVGVVVGIVIGAVQLNTTGEKVLVTPVILCAVAELALMLIFASASLYRLGKLSPLALLQGAHTGKKKAQAKTETTAEAKAEKTAPTAVESVFVKEAEPVKKKRNAHSLRFVWRYVSRHIRRSKVKSVLTILLAALMSAAILQFAQMRTTYEELRENTVISPKFINSISLHQLTKLEKDGFAVNSYYEDTTEADIHYTYDYKQINLAVTNDIGRYTNEQYEVNYAPGYDETSLTELSNVIFLGDQLMENCEYELGQTITMTPKERMQLFMMQVRSEFMETYPDRPMTNEMIYEKFGDAIDIYVGEMAEEFTVAGVITTPSGTFGDMAFTPGKTDLKAQIGTGALLDVAEFRLADNKLVKEMKDRGEELTEGKNGAFIMDTSKLDSVIRTSKLLNSLYPVAVAAALVIGGFLSALIIIQTSKDAAIMRIQGTTKRKTRAILSLEQIMLSLIGLIIGVGVMYAIKGSEFNVVAQQALLFAGLYAAVVIIASIVSAAIATRKNVLELLQTKE